MSGRDDLTTVTLGAALRALPESAPAPDLWPDLARTLAQRRRRALVRRYALPAALAAGLAGALLLPRLPHRGDDVARPVAGAPAANGAGASAASQVADLRQRSQTLERWIAAVAARAPQDGRDLMAAVEVEDLIGLVDVQLGGARNEGEALPLWRQRVALLEDLATIRGNAFALAENGSDARTDPSSLDLVN